jgi:PTH2 family peptidyl-tRNA hydrolase
MIKQLIIIRRDLKMRRGKEIAQGAHASMAFLTSIINEEGQFIRPLTQTELAWITGQFTKVVLQVPDLMALLKVHALAENGGIQSHLIIDSGATEFNGVPTITAVAIGPEDSSALDPLIGTLKLY